MTGPRRRLDDARRREAGFSLVELLVVLVLFGVLSAVVMTSLAGGLRASRQAESRTVVSNALALGSERIARQVRAASPVVKDASTAMSATDLSVEVHDDGVRYRHRFRLTPASGGTHGYVTQTVSRYADDAAATPLSTTSRRLVDDVANTAGEPLFTFYDRDGTELDPAAVTGSQVARVLVTLRGQPREGRAITVRTSVFLRNYREI